MKIFFLIFFLVIASSSFAQSIVSGTVTDPEGEPVIHAVVKLVSLRDSSTLASRTNENGKFQIKSVPDGSYMLKVSYYGFTPYEQPVRVEDDDKKEVALKIQLTQEHLQENEIVVSATRTARNIDDVPIRVEVIPAEDLQESITMGLGSAKAVLSELPGVMSQTTSSATGAATLRIHGLDGRYTQLLVDGIPAFGGLNMNFSILQLPPLNLRQLEIIKGSASGIHGADAIGGIINFLTKNPSSEIPEAQAVINYTSLGGTDLAGYYSQRFDELGVVFHTTYNRQQMRDIDHDGYADLPYQERVFVNPKITYSFSPATEVMIAPSYTFEKRLGGEMSAPMNFDHGDPNIFSTAMTTNRFDVIGDISHKFDEENSLLVNGAIVNTKRQSYRQLSIFDGTENISYADAQWNGDFLPLRLLAGFSFQSENFHEDSVQTFDRSFQYRDIGVFAQSEYTFSSHVSALASVRGDVHNVFGTVVSPRASVMIKPTEALTFRLSAGTGWRAPTIFQEEAEERGFVGVPPIVTTQRERSENYSVESKYKFLSNEWLVSADVNLFQTTIYNTIGLKSYLVAGQNTPVLLWQPAGTLRTRGAEVITQAHRGEVDLFFGYTFAYVRNEAQGVWTEKEFTPAHFINASVLWMHNNSFRLVSDFSFQSPQPLPPNPYAATSPSVITIGGSAEVWITKSLSVFINVENAFDDRQTRTMPLYLGTPGQSNFDPSFVWGPVEGRSVNAGIKYKL